MVNGLSTVSLTLLASTGLLLKFVLPHGRGSALFGLARHDWGELHFVCALVFLGLLAAHLVLHWGWLVTTAKCSRTFAAAAALSILMLLGVTGLLLFFPAQAERPAEGHGGTHRAHGAHAE